MTSTLPDLNISKSPIYESLVAVRGDPYQVDAPAGGWSVPGAGTDFGAANDILGRLLAQGGSDGQGWVAVILVGGPAAAQLSQQLAQGTMAGLPGPFAGGCNPLAVYQALQAIQTMQAMQALQNQAQPWSQAGSAYSVTEDPISARMDSNMASNMAAGIVQNALEASAPSGSMYEQYANQQPDPYAASALTPATAYPAVAQPQLEMGTGGSGMGTAADPAGQYAAMQAYLQAQAQAQMQAQAQAQLGATGQYPVMPMTSQPDPGVMRASAAGLPPELEPALPYRAITSSIPVDRSEWEEDSAGGRFGRIASAMRALRGR